MAARTASLLRCVAQQYRLSVPSLSQLAGAKRQCSSGIVKNELILESPLSDVEIPKIPITKYIFDAQEAHAGRTAFVDGESGDSYTHAEMRELSLRLGSALTRLDLTQGDIVGIVSPNCPEFPITFFGVAAIGAVNTTINCSYTADEIAHQLASSGASAVMAHKSTIAKVKEACKVAKGVRHIIVIGSAEEGVLSFQDLVKDDGTAFPKNVQIDPVDDMVVLPYSSGTTGLPKGVMLTHYNLIANLQQISHPDINTLRANTDEYQEVFLGLLPYYHIYGMVPCMALSLATGTKTVTLPSLIPDQFINTMEKHKITFLHTVPPIIFFLTHNSAIKPELLASTHNMTCGAAPVGEALINQFFKKFGTDILFQEGYGMTEASPVTHLTPKSNLVIGSTGVTLPNTSAKIIDINTGQSIRPEEGEGELCVRGPQVMKGYYNNEKATRETIDEDGWLHTGDVARMDIDGNIFIVDRLKELIKVKGLQVAPAELEDLIRTNPGVADVAVIGLPDVRVGEVPRAYVVPVPGSSMTTEDIADFVEQQVAPHKKLSGGVFFIKAIPKSATGKILRRELKAMALSQLEGSDRDAARMV